MAKATARPDTKAARPGLILIDDDPLIGESLAFVLRDDFDVHLVASRPEARRLLVKMDNMPALALVDLGLVAGSPEFIVLEAGDGVDAALLVPV